MKQNITIEVPTSWRDITLKKYLALLNDIKGYEGDDEAQSAFLLWHLCGLDTDQLKGLTQSAYEELRNDILSFMANQQCELQRIIEIDGVRYGFEPNLSQMPYGAYCDITKFNQLAIDKNWAKIMSILYRPIEKELMGTYSIKKYSGEIDETKFMNVGMDIHFGAYFFFVHLLKDLVNFTLNSTMKMEEVPLNIKRILARSGELMQRL